MLAAATLLLTAAAVLAGIVAVAALLDEQSEANTWHRIYATTLPAEQRWARTDLHELIIQQGPGRHEPVTQRGPGRHEPVIQQGPGRHEPVIQQGPGQLPLAMPPNGKRIDRAA